MLEHSAFHPKPNLGQLAVQDDWKLATSFTRENVELDRLFEKYSKVPQVAFEAFFGNAFFGLLNSGEQISSKDFISRCVASFQECLDGADFFRLICERLNITDLATSFRYAEIGAVNAWIDVGPFRLPSSALVAPSTDELWNELQEKPVFSETEHRKGFEIGFNGPPIHWFALPLSDEVAPYRIERSLLNKALACLPNCAPT